MNKILMRDNILENEMTASGDSKVEFDLDRIVADTFVKEIDFHATVDSTNNAALSHCNRPDLRTPLLVHTAHQTSGRGRNSNQWWSPPGALTFSLVLRPADMGIAKQCWPKASLTAGLSVCFAVSELLPDEEVTLKWPNDVHLQRRKVSGVLIETGSQQTETMVVGIGMNVNNSLSSGADELQSIATSLVDVSGETFDQTRVLISILRQLEIQLTRLANYDPELATDWQQRCALRGNTVQVTTGDSQTTGVCRGIDDDGALVLVTESGVKRLFGGVAARVV